MNIGEILNPQAVRVLSGVSSKKRLLQDISDQSSDVYGFDRDEIFSALQNRETLGSTGVGRGVAIPHARFESLDRVVGLFTRLEKPVDFDSVDGQPVDLVFTLLAPQAEGAEHLKALALVSRTLRAEQTCTTLRSNSTSAAIYALLTENTRTEAA
ncbi:MAG: PTS sugar transporter subunit IIA [Pseudomonadota bacterium]